jgi:hypothetical protein
LAPLNFTGQFTGGGGQFTRDLNRVLFYSEIKNGKLTALEGAQVDVTKPFEGLAG